MKRIFYTWVSSINWYSVVIAAATVFCLNGHDQFSIIYGIQYSVVEGELELISFSKWLLMMSVPIVINMIYLTNLEILRIYIVLRLKSENSFFTMQITGCVVTGIIWSLILIILGLVNDSAKMNGQIMLLIILNQLTWSITGFIIYRMKTVRNSSGVITIASIAAIFLLGEFFPAIRNYLPTTWGMVCRSNLFWPGEITIRYQLLCMMLFLTLLLGVAYIQHRITWRKNDGDY